MRKLGEARSIDATRRMARALGRELADMGIDLDFAPVVDVDTNPANPVIGDRSFSSDPEQVAGHACAFIEALQETGVAACAKHFPGHGDTSVDSHLALPRVDHDLERLRAVELPPFAAASRVGVACVMTAHILLPSLDPERPASFSPAAMTLLREEIGYEGLVFSDDLEMKAIEDHFEPRRVVHDSLEAGVDALLVCRRSDLRDEVLALLESTPASLLERPLERMATFKRDYSGGRGAGPGAPPYPEHEALATALRNGRPLV